MFLIAIDKNGSTPLIRQIYGQIRAQILSGRLQPGSKLPSSRELASRLSVSRNVVMEAFDLLYAEGFTESRHGSGTYIAAEAAYPAVTPPPVTAAPQVSMGYESRAGVINFKPGTPDLSRFPLTIWLRMVRDAYASASEEAFGYGQPEGRMELRRAICDYVVDQRGVNCHPDQIVITAGTTQAIGIAATLLIGDRRDVVLEDPITRDIQLIIRSQGGTIHPVPVDGSGLVTDLLPISISPAFVYVTPSHQFPIGGTLPIQRRIALLNYAEQTGAFVIEDDYDSEFRFDGPPISSLHGLAPERVLYIGTFSKTLCPALRTGYLVLPPALAGRGRERKWLCDLHNETPTQLALAEFINRGHYLRHLARMKRLYGHKRHLLEDSLKSAFGSSVGIIGSPTGLHLAARFAGISFTPELLAKMDSAGVRVYPAEMHAINPGRWADTLVIGYGNLDEAEIRSGVGILRDVLHGSVTGSDGHGGE